VPKEVMAQISLAGFRRLTTFVVFGDTRAEVRLKLRDQFGLDHLRGTPEQTVSVAQIVEAWEAAQVQGAARAGADAEAAAARMPRVMSTGEWSQIRNEFERLFHPLRDRECPGLPLMEHRMQEVTDGDFQADRFSEVISKEEAQAEPFNIQATRGGELKVRKGALTTPLPKEPEALRRSHRLMSVSLVWCRLEDPSIAHLMEWEEADVDDHTNYVLGDTVYGFRARDIQGEEIRGPPWVLIIEYDFRIRKEAFRLIMRGEEGRLLPALLKVARKDTEIRERYFTTPMAVAAPDNNRPDGGGGGNQGGRFSPYGKRGGKAGSWGSPGGGARGWGAPGAKGGGKDGGGQQGAFRPYRTESSHSWLSTTPGGRPICFAYNSPFERCSGMCGRVHVCRQCMGNHPVHMCSPVRQGGAAPGGAPGGGGDGGGDGAGPGGGGDDGKGKGAGRGKGKDGLDRPPLRWRGRGRGK